MKKNLFRPNTPSKYFHINLDFEVHPLFKDLDWIFVQKNIQSFLINEAIQLHALVMMDTHVHLLIESAENHENFFCEKLSTRLNGKKSTDGHCEPILNYSQYLNTYKYIYRNPVEAGLVDSVENYSYSSVKTLLGLGVNHCQVIDHLGLIQNPLSVVNWLNNKSEYRFLKVRLTENYLNDFFQDNSV